MRAFAESFYNSQAWKQNREAYKKSVGGLCERCKAKGLIRPADIVHHKKYITPENINDPSITLDWNNLEALCRDCHEAEHHTVKKRYRFDRDGKIIVTEAPHLEKETK